MPEVHISLLKNSDDSYTIEIGSGIFISKLSALLRKYEPSELCFIADSHVGKIYQNKISDAFPGRPFFTFKAGEENKRLSTIESLFEGLAEKRLDRKSMIVALGGGVTGDMSGFLASVYMRGIPFIQIPTSLLAMADSSVGGKTGVDTNAGKNLIGAFYQPKAVIIDTDFLKTLPDAEFTNGMAEIIKHGAIFDAEYFSFLRDNADAIQSLNETALIEMLTRSCQIKAKVVSEDEKERGLRQILNFGHTIGHAVEQASDFSIHHGFAVAIGMAASASIAVKRGILSKHDCDSLVSLLDGYGLLSESKKLKNLCDSDIMDAAYLDKKNSSGEIRFVMIDSIGHIHQSPGGFSHSLSKEELLSALDELKSR